MGAETIDQIFNSLREDEWRKKNPFSEVIEKAHEVMLHPFSNDGEKIAALNLWAQKNQPCLFGRYAAATKRMHYCIIDEKLINSGDSAVRLRIQRERLLWKQRSLRNSRPEHGFMLVVVSPRVAFAAPDDNLQKLSGKVRDLWGAEIEKDEHGNDVSYETLFLQNPKTEKVVKFTFSLDYFGAQGDGRWWQDHRIPGGIAYSANSIGHMMKSREWFDGLGHQEDWAVQTAMRTVNESQETRWGKAIWLKNLESKGPHVPGGCPYSGGKPKYKELEGKDWSFYSGNLSTDHSVREEFIRPGGDPPPNRNEWIQDLSYLYRPETNGFAEFSAGEEVSLEGVYSEIGDPSSWRVLSKEGPGEQRKKEISLEIKALLAGLEGEWQEKNPENLF